MAAKRIMSSAIDWAKIAERVPKEEMPKFLAFRAKSDGYLRRMMANPEQPPKLDWDYYKKSVPIPGMVDNFMKQYESMQIPYPKDTLSGELAAQEKEVMAAVESFKAESNRSIEKYKAEIANFEAMLPYNQMTLEDFYEAHPEEAIDCYNNPTLWPHTPEEQVGYKSNEPEEDDEH